MSTREYTRDRSDHASELAVELAAILKIFWDSKDAEVAAINYHKSCIRQAFELQEKIVTSINQFNIKVEPYLTRTKKGRRVTTRALLENLEDMDLHNLMQNRRTFTVDGVGNPTEDTLWNMLRGIMVVVPGISMRRVGRSDDLDEPVVIWNQHMLVVYGSQEERNKFRAAGKTFLYQICRVGGSEV
jgi:hypothetical protein